MEGCSNLGAFVLCSSSLTTLWLSDLLSLSKTVITFPLSFTFVRCDHCLKSEFTKLYQLLHTEETLRQLLTDSFILQVFNCPQLREISLEFSRQGSDSTDLITMVDNLGRSCQKLQNIHIASTRLSHAAVLALTAAQLRFVKIMTQWLFCSPVIDNLTFSKVPKSL